MRRLSLVLIFAVIVGAGAGIVALTRGSLGDGPLTPDQATSRMRTVLAQMSFPPGYQASADTARLFSQPGTVYAPGVAEGLAGDEWFCAWAGEWRTYRSQDPGRASAAVDTILGPYPSGPFWESINPPDRPGLLSDVQAAKLGDPRKLLAEMSAFQCRVP